MSSLSNDREFQAFQGAAYRITGDCNPVAAPAGSRKRSCGVAELDDVGQAGVVIDVDAVAAGSAGDEIGVGAVSAATEETLRSMNLVMASWRIPPERHYFKVMDDLENLQLTVALALSDDLKGFTQAKMEAVVNDFKVLSDLVGRIGYTRKLKREASGEVDPMAGVEAMSLDAGGAVNDTQLEDTQLEDTLDAGGAVNDSQAPW